MNANQPPKNTNASGVGLQRLHVIPVGDLEIHAAQESCWCHPTQTEPDLWVHNAKDCREARERATGEKCSEGWVNIAECVTHRCSASIVVYVTCSKCKWAGRFSMNPNDTKELERRIATAHINAKVGGTCDGQLAWKPWTT